MKKGIMSGAFSLFLVMAFMPGAVFGEEVEKAEIVTEDIPAEVETSAEKTADLQTRIDTAMSSEIAPSELPALPVQPSLLVDEDSRVMYTGVVYDGSWNYGSCSQTCYPCRSNADCPPIWGMNQKCMQWCP